MAQAEGKFLVTSGTESTVIQAVGYRQSSYGDFAEGLGTLRASAGQHGVSSQDVVVESKQPEIFDMTHANDVIRECKDTCPTLQARMGTGGNQIPLVLEPNNNPAYCIQSNTIDRSDTAGANRKGVIEDKSYPLNTVDRHAVCYAIGNGQADQAGLHDKVGALNCMHDQQGVIYAIDRAAFNQGENAKYDFQIDNSEINSTIVARGPSAVLDCRLSVWIVRRLTPIECERLQAFPDDWTKYDKEGKELKDTPRYKALGNSIAIPCAVRVFQGIAEAESDKEKQKCLKINLETA